MTEDTENMQNSSSFFTFLRAAWVLWVAGLVFAAGIFVSTVSLTGGAHAWEIGILLAAGILAGGLIRGLIPARWTTIVLVLVVALGVSFFRTDEPWSRLWPVLVPASAIGVMIGNVIRHGILDSHRKIIRDVWIVNGVEMPSTDGAKTTSLASLASWDSAAAGRFVVERNEGLFEAVGNPSTGFLVHCAARFQDESEWRMLGSAGGTQETEIRIPSGTAFVPIDAVVDLDSASRALRGFFHYRGPDPELAWTSGDAVLDLKFG
ncbi:hypothetical protein [Arthrobacter sp. C9C5]|uniref:hypothetical protein n=1 Tax=Arthrobacter sp. C9C5 TaxID=2735267 RepID=UPI001585AE6F|nr:hypothetical protein [Arthrobacter sp. C9C5]NUU31148.1 hypothetical protein [Arthrobacter sp. C9C5]